MTANSPTYQAVAAPAAPLDTWEFLKELLPVDGPYWMLAYRRLGTKGMTHESFDSVDVLAARAKELDATRGTEVWHAVGSFWYRHDDAKDGGAEKCGRKKENVNSLTAFFLDIDVDPDKPGKSYSTIEDAEEGLAAFVQTFGLPYHCLVYSGGGLHVYWMLEEDIPRNRWTGAAIKFKDATRVAGLLADPTRTADPTSLLRPIGTKNKKPKYGAEGRPIKGQWHRRGRVSLSAFEAACERVRDSSVAIEGTLPSGATFTATTLAMIPPRHWFDELQADEKDATLDSMLASLPSEYVSDRVRWLAVGASLAGTEGLPRDMRFDKWRNWSQSTNAGVKSWIESTEEEHRIRWDGLTRSGVGALITMAKASGLVPEMLHTNADLQTAFPAVAAAIKACGERWSMEQAIAYMREHVVFVRADNQYLHKGLPVTKEALDTSLARHFPASSDRPMNASGLLKKGFGEIADYIGYKPGEDRIFVDCDGWRIVNIWRQHPIEPVKPTIEEARTFVEFVKHLENGNTETAAGVKRFLVKCCYLYKNPKARIRHATLLIGKNEGCGKSTLMLEIPRALFGSANVRSVETREVSSDFNGYAQEARILVFSELWLGSRKDAQTQANNLKTLITDDRIVVIKKGKDGRAVENCTTIFASSNYEDAAFFGAYDRRHDVISTDAPMMRAELAERIYLLIKHKPGAILWLILRYETEAAGFDPNAAPPQTAAKCAMMEANRGGWAQRMRDAFEAREVPFNGDAVAVSDVIAWLGDEFRPAPSDRAVRTELLSMADGAYSVLAQRRQGRTIQQKRVVVLRNISSWKEAGPSALFTHYDETVVKHRNL